MKQLPQKLLLLLGGVLLFLLPQSRDLTVSFLLALLLASCTEPLLQHLSRHKIPRWLSVLGLILFLLTPLVLFLSYSAFTLIHFIRDLLTEEAPFLALFNADQNWLDSILPSLPPLIQEELHHLTAQLRQQRNLIAEKALLVLGKIGSQWAVLIPKFFTALALFFLFFFFCSVGYPAVSSSLLSLLPEDWRSHWNGFRDRTSKNLQKWCKAQLALSGLLLTELCLGMLALRISHPFILSLLVLVIDFIPLIGCGLILLPWAVVLWLTNQRIKSLGLCLLWAAVWGTRTIIEPRLVGSQLQLPTALSLFSAVLGMQLLGWKGLILFPILAGVFFSKSKV